MPSRERLYIVHIPYYNFHYIFLYTLFSIRWRTKVAFTHFYSCIMAGHVSGWCTRVCVCVRVCNVTIDDHPTAQPPAIIHNFEFTSIKTINYCPATRLITSFQTKHRSAHTHAHITTINYIFWLLCFPWPLKLISNNKIEKKNKM